MLRFDRDETRFVGGDLVYPLTVGNRRDTLNHDPVLATLVMELQRQRSARFDLDAFDPEARTFLQYRVGTPRSGHRFVQLVGFVTARLELPDHLLYTLQVVAVGN